MKLTRKQLQEEVNPFAGTPEGFVGVEDSATRDYLNALLSGVTAGKFLTPYIALERISKVLANYHIFPARTTFLEGDSGLAIWPVSQFGLKAGMNNDGEVVTAPHSEYSVYFEYQMNDSGSFDIFCEVVSQEDLEELLDDVEDEMEEGDDLQEEVSKDMPKPHDNAVLVAPETGPRKVPGAGKGVPDPNEEECGCDHDEEDEMSLDENYHASYSDAIQTAVKAAKKRGYEVDQDEYHSKVASGPRKPSEGKTVSHTLSLTKDGKPTKKGLSIQVYNRGGDKTPYELNHYISEEVALDEVVTKRKMTSKELVARAAYLAKHKEKLAAADTGVSSSKSFKDINSERGDYTSEPSKMKASPKSSSKYMDIKEEEKAPFPGPYDKKGEAKDKNVARNAARKVMKAVADKVKKKVK